MRLLIGTVTTAFLVLAEVTVPNVTISSAMKFFTLPIALVLILNWNDQAYCSQGHHSVQHKKTELAGTQMKIEDHFFSDSFIILETIKPHYIHQLNLY